MGKKVDIKEGEDNYYEVLDEARRKNRLLGYGDSNTDWERKYYEKQRRLLKWKEKRNY